MVTRIYGPKGELIEERHTTPEQDAELIQRTNEFLANLAEQIRAEREAEAAYLATLPQLWPLHYSPETAMEQ